MQLALAKTNHPYMTKPAWAEYQRFYESGGVVGLEPNKQLQEKFPALRLGATADFNHFWAYPLAAAAIRRALELVGLHLGPHQAFLLLHAILFSAALLACGMWQRTYGVGAMLTLTLASPMLWFSNKVHTEWMTVCVSIFAVAAAMRGSWTMAAVALATISTQNISFALPAALCTLFALYRLYPTGKTSPFEVILLCATLVLALAHPAYYYFRLGVITPQLLAGGAQLDGGFLVSFNYLLDPDIGLLANWPLGLLLLLFAAVRARSDWALLTGNANHRQVLALFAVIAFANLFSQGANQNMNSGATVHVARYGLWYLCLFYPLLVHLYKALFVSGYLRRRLAIVAAGLALLVLTTWNTRAFWPTRPQTYTSPSPAAKLVYSKFPGIYDPSWEIFFERNSGLGEVGAPRPSITLGPDCRKALYLGLGPATPATTEPQILGNSLCGMAPSQASRSFARQLGARLAEDHAYFTIPSEVSTAMRASALLGSTYLPGAGDTSFQQFLGRGWGAGEAWGTWSTEPAASIGLKVNDINRPVTVVLHYNAFFHASHSTLVVRPTVNGVAMSPVTVTPAGLPGAMQLNLPADSLRHSGGLIDIELQLDGIRSPAELGLSADARTLGIGLTKLEVK